jgi:hypothetical protein
MAHRSARLTEFGRLLLVQRITELGWPADNHVWLTPACEVLSVPGHATMLITGRQQHRCSAALRRSEAAVEQASEQPGGDAYLYDVRDEQAYLESDDDDGKLEIAEPTPEPAPSKCWFCRKSHQQVRILFGAEYPVRDPNNFANETPIYICNECVAKFAESLARSASGPPA